MLSRLGVAVVEAAPILAAWPVVPVGYLLNGDAEWKVTRAYDSIATPLYSHDHKTKGVSLDAIDDSPQRP